MEKFFELAEHVIWEKIGNQILIANMTTGTYCTINSKISIALWHFLLAGLSLEEIAIKLKNYYSVVDVNYQKDLFLFVDELVVKNILSYVEKPISSHAFSLDFEFYDPRKVYEKPSLVVYGDIDTLLQIDPIDDIIVEELEAL